MYVTEQYQGGAAPHTLPAHWEMRRLKYAVAINPDTLPEQTDPDYILRYVDIGDVDASGAILQAQEMRFRDAPSRARRGVQHGDVIISTVRTYLGAIALIEHPPANLVVSTGFAVLRPGPGIEPAFLWRLVQSPRFVALVMANAEGAGYPAITPARLARLPIWLPPLAEQCAIAAYLDHKMERVSALIGKKERLIALLQERRAALINRAVTRGLDAGAPVVECHPKRGYVILGAAQRSEGSEACGEEILRCAQDDSMAREGDRSRQGERRGQDDSMAREGDRSRQGERYRNEAHAYGEIPAHWRRTRLKRCLVSLRDGTHGAFERVEDGVPLLSAKNVLNGRLVITDQESCISYADFARIDSSGYLRRGDLLLTIVGAIGRVAIFDHAGPLAFQRSVAMLRFQPRHDVRYFYYLAQCACFQAALAAHTRQSAQEGIYLGDIAQLPVIVPPLVEQRAIASYLDRETAGIDALIASVCASIERLREYSMALIAGAVSGAVTAAAGRRAGRRAQAHLP